MKRLAVQVAERYLSQPGQLLRSVFVAAAGMVAVITVVQLYLGPSPGRSMPAAFVPEPLWIPSGSIVIVEDAERKSRWSAYLGLPLGFLQFKNQNPGWWSRADWVYYLDTVRVSPFGLAADISILSVCLLAVAALLLRSFRRHLSRRRVHHLCVRCGYSLQGLPSHGCPECGMSALVERLWMHCRDATAFYRAVFAVAMLQATIIIEFVLLRIDLGNLWHRWWAAGSVAATLQDVWFLVFCGLSIVATAVVWHFERRTVGFARRRVSLAIACGVMQVVTLWMLYGLTALRIGAG